jgi:hypothetical protein
MIIPAIHYLETGKPLVFTAAVGKRHRIAESPALKHHIVPRGCLFFYHKNLPEITPEVDVVDLRRK